MLFLHRQPLWGYLGRFLNRKVINFGFQFAVWKKNQIKSTVTEHFCCYRRGQRVRACGHDTHLATHCNNLSKIKPSPQANLPVVPNFPWNVVWKIKYHHCQVQNPALTCHRCYRTALQPLCPKQEGGEQQKWKTQPKRSPLWDFYLANKSQKFKYREVAFEVKISPEKLC